MKLTLRYRGLAVVASAVAVAACADDSTAPKSMIASLTPGAAAHSLSASSLHSNNTQYRPQTMPYQSNRSGSATLTSRALLNKNGSTDFTVTTGALDAAGAPGSISKLQEKFLSPNKEVLATKNFNGLTGAVQTKSFPGLMAHSWIQTQGNVGGIDGKRTDVVTITERVNKRPDLAVTAVNAPQRAKPNQDIIVTADLRESNGDVGAYDNCVLYVDGAEAARINHQWVADGDLVNCAFRISIAAIGNHTLEVRSENVNPGDWDLANNRLSTSIEIVNPEVRLGGWMNAWEIDYKYRQYQDYKVDYDNGNTYQNFYDYTNTQRSSQVYFYASAGGQAGLNNIQAVDLSFTSGGVTFGSISSSNLNSGGCTYLTADNNGTWLNMCSYDGYTWANGGANAGRAVYYNYSFNYDNYYYGYYYSYGPESSDNTWGNGNVFAGDDVTMSLSATGANGNVVVANSSLTLGDWYDYYYYWYNNQPMTCTDYRYDDTYYSYYGYNYHYCYENIYQNKQRSGYSNF